MKDVIRKLLKETAFRFNDERAKELENQRKMDALIFNAIQRGMEEELGYDFNNLDRKTWVEAATNIEDPYSFDADDVPFGSTIMDSFDLDGNDLYRYIHLFTDKVAGDIINRDSQNPKWVKTIKKQILEVLEAYHRNTLRLGHSRTFKETLKGLLQWEGSWDDAFGFNNILKDEYHLFDVEIQKYVSEVIREQLGL